MKTMQMLSTRSGHSVARFATRACQKQQILRPLSVYASSTTTHQTTPALRILSSARSFSVCSKTCIGLTPESDNPTPSNPEPPVPSTATEPTALSDAEYQEIADQYMNTLQLVLEEAADSDLHKGLEVEYSAGVLTITHPGKGDYVINKQPPNKQIWLSSPISGPKRFDWVLDTSTSHDAMNSKQDTEGSVGQVGDDGTLGGGKWIYLRDGSSLSEILKDEVGVVVTQLNETDATAGQEGSATSATTSGVEG